MNFWLGTHHENWLASFGEPLFVSHRRLERRKTLPRAVAPWALDSGGFTELNLYGRWRTERHNYVAAVRRYRDQVGMLEWAAPMDWMVEPSVRERTGLTVAEHQRLTLHNYLDLLSDADELPFIPVLQGWDRDDYLRHVDSYEAAGVDLTALALVGVGSVCRRQNTDEASVIVDALHGLGLRLHGFGVKITGLGRFARQLVSADSLSWSFTARRLPPLEGCATHKNCANCPVFARRWLDRVRAIPGVA